MFRFVLAIAAAAILTTTLPAPSTAQDAKKPRETPEQKAVRAYLKENLPTGKWEEIKWWGTARLMIDGRPGNTVTRLKFRAANQFGGMSVHDDVFEFSGNRVIRHGFDSPINSNRDRIFSRN